MTGSHWWFDTASNPPGVVVSLNAGRRAVRSLVEAARRLVHPD